MGENLYIGFYTFVGLFEHVLTPTNNGPQLPQLSHHRGDAGYIGHDPDYPD